MQEADEHPLMEEVLNDAEEHLSTRNGVFCLQIRDGTRHVIDHDMPPPPHALKGGHCFSAEDLFCKPDNGDVLIVPRRAVTLREHKRPCGLQHGVVGDCICPVAVAGENGARDSYIPPCQTDGVLHRLRIQGEFPDQPLLFQILNRYQSASPLAPGVRS